MKSRDNEIKSIDTGPICLQSSPCQHDITITYQNGKQESGRMWATQIAGLCWQNLSQEDQKHFEHVTKSGYPHYDDYLLYKNNNESSLQQHSIFHIKKIKENKNTSSKLSCTIL